MSMTEPGKGRLAAIKLGFIGVGNMGGAFIKGCWRGVLFPGRTCYTTTRTRPGSQMDELGVAAARTTPR